jgi:hypothetical protein
MLIGGALIIVAVALVVWRRGAPGHWAFLCLRGLSGLVVPPAPRPGTPDPPICLLHRKFIK